MVARKHGHPKIKIHRDSSKNLLSSATPYAISDLLARLRSRIDVVLLGFFLGAASAGVYNAAFRIVLVFLLIPFFAAMALFPLSSRLYLSSREKLTRLYHGTLNLTILFGLPVAFGLWLTAPQIIDLLYGEEFSESVTVLRILTWLIFLATLKSIMGVFLMSCDLQAKRTRSQGVSAIVAVIGNILLIYFLALTGAAIAVLIAEIVLVFLFAWYLRPIFGWPKIGSRLAIGALAAGSFCLLFLILPTVPIFIVIPVSAIIYMGILLSFKDIRENEGKRVLGLVRNEMARFKPGPQKAS
jgi:O-antigen/teichoic acid export membrane protein